MIPRDEIIRIGSALAFCAIFSARYFDDSWDSVSFDVFSVNRIEFFRISKQIRTKRRNYHPYSFHCALSSEK